MPRAAKKPTTKTTALPYSAAKRLSSGLKRTKHIKNKVVTSAHAIDFNAAVREIRAIEQRKHVLYAAAAKPPSPEPEKEDLPAPKS